MKQWKNSLLRRLTALLAAFALALSVAAPGLTAWAANVTQTVAVTTEADLTAAVATAPAVGSGTLEIRVGAALTLTAPLQINGSVCLFVEDGIETLTAAAGQPLAQVNAGGCLEFICSWGDTKVQGDTLFAVADGGQLILHNGTFEPTTALLTEDTAGQVTINDGRYTHKPADGISCELPPYMVMEYDEWNGWYFLTYPLNVYAQVSSDSYTANGYVAAGETVTVTVTVENYGTVDIPHSYAVCNFAVPDENGINGHVLYDFNDLGGTLTTGQATATGNYGNEYTDPDVPQTVDYIYLPDLLAGSSTSCTVELTVPQTWDQQTIWLEASCLTAEAAPVNGEVGDQGLSGRGGMQELTVGFVNETEDGGDGGWESWEVTVGTEAELTAAVASAPAVGSGRVQIYVDADITLTAPLQINGEVFLFLNGSVQALTAAEGQPIAQVNDGGSLTVACDMGDTKVQGDTLFTVADGGELTLHGCTYESATALLTADTAGQVSIVSGRYVHKPADGISYTLPAYEVWQQDEAGYWWVTLPVNVQQSVSTLTPGETGTLTVTIENWGTQDIEYGYLRFETAWSDEHPNNGSWSALDWMAFDEMGTLTGDYTATVPGYSSWTVDETGSSVQRPYLAVHDLAAGETVTVTFEFAVPAEYDGYYVVLDTAYHPADTADSASWDHLLSGTGGAWYYGIGSAAGTEGGDSGEGGSDQEVVTVTTYDELAAALAAGNCYINLGADIQYWGTDTLEITGNTGVQLDLAGYHLVAPDASAVFTVRAGSVLSIVDEFWWNSDRMGAINGTVLFHVEEDAGLSLSNTFYNAESADGSATPAILSADTAGTVYLQGGWYSVLPQEGKYTMPAYHVWSDLTPVDNYDSMQGYYFRLPMRCWLETDVDSYAQVGDAITYTVCINNYGDQVISDGVLAFSFWDNDAMAYTNFDDFCTPVNEDLQTEEAYGINFIHLKDLAANAVTRLTFTGTVPESWDNRVMSLDTIYYVVNEPDKALSEQGLSGVGQNNEIWVNLVKGDANQDMVCNTADALVLANVIAEKVTPTDEELAEMVRRCDYNKDGGLTVEDLARLLDGLVNG